jgi:tRNA pseudouridine38-40 synthase
MGRILKLTVEYDGTNYVGWQRQARGVSIQGLLEGALAAFEGGPVVVHGAGRTDAGVHALGQVASVALNATLEASTLQRALNAVLPPDVRVVAAAEAAPGFHARFDAISKIYEYRIVNAPFVSAFQHRYVWHVPGTLDREAMQAGAQVLVGRHDFAAFQGSGAKVSTTERTILEISWNVDHLDQRPGPTLVLSVSGDGFLRHMVRTIAGTLVDVGLGRWPASHVAAILQGRDRTRAGRAAPARGLFLVEVTYRG